jgi:hypothetical protein
MPTGVKRKAAHVMPVATGKFCVSAAARRTPPRYMMAVVAGSLLVAPIGASVAGRIDLRTVLFAVLIQASNSLLVVRRKNLP